MVNPTPNALATATPTAAPEGTQPTASGIQPGGIPPELDQVLSDPQQVSPEAANVIRAREQQRNADYTRKTEQLAEDVRLAGYFRKLRQDPRFDRFVKAAEKDDWPGYHRSELGLVDVPSNAPQPTDHLLATGEPSENGSGNPMLGHVQALQKQNGELRDQVTVLQNELHQFVSQHRAAEFDRSHPDWRQSAPELMKVMQEHPTLPPGDALALVRARAGQPVTPPAGAGVQGQEAPTEAPQPPLVNSPPPAANSTALGVRQNAAEPQVFSKNLAAGLREAFQAAKKAHGVSL